MRPIILPNKFIYINEEDLFKIFKSKNKNLSTKIDNRDIEFILKSIDRNNTTKDAFEIKRNFIYFLIRFCETDDIENPISLKDGGVPSNGIELINKDTGDGFGVYHCHISNLDKGVLIWYLRYSKGKVKLKFKYEFPHPSDDYRNILLEAYNDSESFNIFTGEYLSDNKHLLNFDINENIILKFRDFKK